MAVDFQVPEALHNLGEPLRVHPPKPGAGRAGYFAIAAVLAALSALCVVGIVNPPDNPPPQIVLVILTAVPGLLSLVCFCIGALKQSYTLLLFPEGLAKVGAGTPEVIRWSDAAELYVFINPIAGKHRLVAKDGRQMVIDMTVKDGKALGQAVQQTMLERMLPVAVEALDRGETLNFGPLRLNHSTLQYKDKRLAWSETGKVDFLYNAYTRCVQFEVSGGSGLLPWCVVKAHDIPNLDVFKTLLQRKHVLTQAAR
ncbi:MAG TPA: DUF6585 family protein [Bryobacteraceae bacterium]|nr:DUF6585 family protein [Bryobacteraceae bacterium]